jgi:tetratricopeptide (TPR) repeat protein
MDQAFGVTRTEETRQAPSFTLGLARINRYYKERNMEYCLVEINQLLNYYPNAIQLYKMKGTVLLKMRQPRLAEAAWVKALELAPADRSIKKALDRLRRRYPSEAPASSSAPAPSSAPGPGQVPATP